MTEDEMRAAFEAYFRKFGYTAKQLEYSRSGGCSLPLIYYAWLAWQEATLQAEQRHATPPASPDEQKEKASD